MTKKVSKQRFYEAVYRKVGKKEVFVVELWTEKTKTGEKLISIEAAPIKSGEKIPVNATAGMGMSMSTKILFGDSQYYKTALDIGSWLLDNSKVVDKLRGNFP